MISFYELDWLIYYGIFDSLEASFEGGVNLVQPFGLRLSGGAARFVSGQVGLLWLGLRLLLHRCVPHERVTSINTHTHTQKHGSQPKAVPSAMRFNDFQSQGCVFIPPIHSIHQLLDISNNHGGHDKIRNSAGTFQPHLNSKHLHSELCPKAAKKNKPLVK